jgi:hypothetical protein
MLTEGGDFFIGSVQERMVVGTIVEELATRGGASYKFCCADVLL